MLFTAPPQPPKTIDQEFAIFIADLRRHVSAKLAERIPYPLAATLISLICTRLARIGYAFAVIANRVREGRVRAPYRRRAPLVPPASGPDALPRLPRGAPPPSPLRGLPRHARWLLHLVPMVGYAPGCLATLLANPAMAPLLAAPGMVRTLRPLCRMLGLVDPEEIKRRHMAARTAVPPAARPCTTPGEADAPSAEAAPAAEMVRAVDLHAPRPPVRPRTLGAWLRHPASNGLAAQKSA